MNRDGERVVDLAVSFDLMISNTFYSEKDEHIITYKREGNIYFIGVQTSEK